MRDIRQIFQLAGQNFFGWKRNPRIGMTFLLAFVLCLLLSDEVLTYSRRYETSLQILEPFIWTRNSVSADSDETKCMAGRTAGICDCSHCTVQFVFSHCAECLCGSLCISGKCME